jgi:hypothetical protein
MAPADPALPSPPRRPAGRRRRLAALLVAIWIVVAAFDVGKAVHIDDTAHLEIAEAIAAHPLHPMSQLVNWVNEAEPIHQMNQPHLLFYLMAVVIKIAPEHAEVLVRLLWVMISGAGIWLFYALANRVSAPRPLLVTAILCLGPAFMPAQNLMVDVPLLTLWLGFFVLIEQSRTEDSRAARRALLAAGFVVGAACLVKYVSLVLLPIFALAVWWRGGRRAIALVLVPIGVLVAWSALNWFDYGGIHMITRPPPNTGHKGALAAAIGVLGRGGLWLMALGAVTPFALAFVPPLWRDRGGRWLLGGTGAAAVAIAVVGHRALSGEPVIQSVLRGLFLANGALVIGLAVRATRRGRWWDALRSGREPPGWIPFAWAVGAAVFVIVLAPFIAVRHVLLSLPAIYLHIDRGPDAARLSRRGLALALALNAVAGTVLATSDASLAGIYRSMAPTLAAQYCRGEARCVAVGHWGWQWYARQSGMSIYDRQRTQLTGGDRVIIPELPGKQTLRPTDAARLSLIDEIVVPASPATVVRTIATEHSGPQGDRSGGIYYFWTSVPWTVTDRPLDRFRVYDVRSAPAP